MSTYRGQQQKSPIDKAVQAFARTRAGGWLFINVFPAIDRWLIPRTKGRIRVAMGQPILLLHTCGAKSGQARQTPLLYTPRRRSRDPDRRARAGLGRATDAMITRTWRGWTSVENADAYEGFLLTELFPSMRHIEGFRGADVLRRPDDDEVAFITLTRFDSLEDIRAFAGDDYERPVLEPRARVLLSRHEAEATHFTTSSFDASTG